MTYQVWDGKMNHAKFFTPRTKAQLGISDIQVALAVTISCQNRHDIATRRRVRTSVTKRLLSRCDTEINTAQPNVGLGKSCDRHKLMYMMEELTITFRSRYCTRFSAKPIILPHTPSIEKEWIFEVNARPIDLLPTMGSVVAQQRAKQIFRTIEKKLRSSIQRARRSGIGTNTSKPSASIRRWAFFDKRTPSPMVARNAKSAKTKNYVMANTHAAVRWPRTPTPLHRISTRNRTAMAPESNDLVPKRPTSSTPVNIPPDHQGLEVQTPPHSATHQTS